MTGEAPDTAYCLGCGYALRGLPEAVCPECGRAFIPDDPTTYQDGSAKWPWPFRPQAPPRWQAPVLAVAGALYVYWSGGPGGLSGSLDFGACLIIPVAGATVCVLALDYFGRSVAVRTDRARALLDRGERTQGRGWRWSVLPLFLTLILSVHLWSWPLRGRFHLSRPAFARAVQQIQSGADPKTLQGWIGLYEVHDISDWGTGVIFFRTGWLGWFDPVGFVYRPSDTPRSRGDERLARFWFTKTE